MIKEEDFKYCPKCSGLFKKQNEHSLICTNCGLQYYFNPKPCNAVILKNSEGKILFVKRKHNPQKGFWDLPGGFTNINETIEESVQREIMEELKIEIQNYKYIGSMYDTYNFGGIEAYTLCFAFEADLPENARIIPSDDAEEIIFFHPNEIPLNELGFKSQSRFLKEYFTI